MLHSSQGCPKQLGNVWRPVPFLEARFLTLSRESKHCLHTVFPHLHHPHFFSGLCWLFASPMSICQLLDLMITLPHFSHSVVNFTSILCEMYHQPYSTNKKKFRSRELKTLSKNHTARLQQSGDFPHGKIPGGIED
jgi:hypothetical protein